MCAVTVDAPHSGNAYNDRACDLPACGRKIGKGMKIGLRTSEAGTGDMMDEGGAEIGNKLMSELSSCQVGGEIRRIEVALLTGGGDRPYAYGLATELIAKGIGLDIIGSDDLDCPE